MVGPVLLEFGFRISLGFRNSDFGFCPSTSERLLSRGARHWLHGQRIEKRQLRHTAASKLGELDRMIRMPQKDLVLLADHDDDHFVRAQVFGSDALHILLADRSNARAKLLPKLRIPGAPPGKFVL